jgi:hypothetical protein
MNSVDVSMEIGEYEQLWVWAWWVWTVWMIYEQWGCEHDGYEQCEWLRIMSMNSEGVSMMSWNRVND